MPTHVIRTHREAFPEEVKAAHEHDWRIYATHSLLPAGDGHSYKCECGWGRDVMNPRGGPRTETFWVPL